MKRLLWLLLLAVPLSVAGVLSLTAPSNSAPTLNTGSTGAGTFPPCKVTLAVINGGTQAQATIVSGCVGPGFTFRSFVGIRTNDLFDQVTSAPWIVNLPSVPPTCQWQIDFSAPITPVTAATASGTRHLYAFLTGGGPCPPPTTTTTTTTTVPPPTTTTTTSIPVGPTTTTTTRPPLPGCQSCQIPTPGPVTTTTLPPITQEQQQVNIAPGVTAGNG